jgi:hypothetical protein
VDRQRTAGGNAEALAFTRELRLKRHRWRLTEASLQDDLLTGPKLDVVELAWSVDIRKVAHG